MSARPYIRCDGDGCMVEDQPAGSPVTFTEARRRLHKFGWHFTQTRRDICPRCWKAGRR